MVTVHLGFDCCVDDTFICDDDSKFVLTTESLVEVEH